MKQLKINLLAVSVAIILVGCGGSDNTSKNRSVLNSVEDSRDIEQKTESEQFEDDLDNLDFVVESSNGVNRIRNDKLNITQTYPVIDFSNFQTRFREGRYVSDCLYIDFGDQAISSQNVVTLFNGEYTNTIFIYRDEACSIDPAVSDRSTGTYMLTGNTLNFKGTELLELSFTDGENVEFTNNGEIDDTSDLFDTHYYYGISPDQTRAVIHNNFIDFPLLGYSVE